ncbi:hypothetical protein ACFL6Y_03915 [Elusimicrobiota bacterium]
MKFHGSALILCAFAFAPILFLQAETTDPQENLMHGKLSPMFDLASPDLRSSAILPVKISDDPDSSDPGSVNIPLEFYFGYGTPPQTVPGVNSINSAYMAGAYASDKLFERFLDIENDSGPAAIALRMARATVYDFPMASMANLAVHEVFGHGGAAREIGMDTNYSFSPYPFMGGAATWYDPKKYGELSSQDRIRLTSAGTMATQTGALEMRRRMLESGAVHWSAWPLWALQKYDLSRYITSTLGYSDQELAFEASQGNDIAKYIMLLNEGHGKSIDRSRKELQMAAMWNAADPMAIAALYNYGYKHIIKGNNFTPPPLVTIGKYQYSMGTRSGLTPTGPEMYLDLYARNPSNNMLLEVNGRGGFDDQIGGGARLSNIPLTDNASFALHANAWKQNEFSTDDSFTGIDGGGSVKWYPTDRIGIQLESGYKTDGSLMGRQYDEGGYFSGGILVQPQPTK